jgi:hypothetical protein
MAGAGDGLQMLMVAANILNKQLQALKRTVLYLGQGQGRNRKLRTFHMSSDFDTPKQRGRGTWLGKSNGTMWTGFIAARYVSVTERCEAGNKPSGSRKCTHLLVYLSYYQFLNIDRASYSLFMKLQM